MILLNSSDRLSLSHSIQLERLERKVSALIKKVVVLERVLREHGWLEEVER